VIIAEELGYLSSEKLAEVSLDLRKLAVKTQNLITSLKPKVVQEEMAAYDC
jgi:hypothetical protein